MWGPAPHRVAPREALRARPRPANGVGLGQHPSRFAFRAQRDGSERSGYGYYWSELPMTPQGAGVATLDSPKMEASRPECKGRALRRA